MYFMIWSAAISLFVFFAQSIIECYKHFIGAPVSIDAIFGALCPNVLLYSLFGYKLG